VTPDLTVKIGALELPNPVLLASGTCGYGLEMTPHGDIGRLGAVVVKGLSLRPSPGNPPPRIVETPSGMLNSIGLENIGLDAFVADKLPRLRRTGARVIVNFYGSCRDDYRELASRLDGVAGVAALEMNISCPNVERGGVLIGQEPEEVHRAVAAVRAVTRLPRARALVLAGSLMGGEIEAAVREVRAQGLLVISLNMAGSVPDAADLVVTDPVQAGVMAVMAIADTAKFTVERLKRRVF
jgi:dihydroorotate dehydrogenase (NAD+) catalytic subunit